MLVWRASRLCVCALNRVHCCALIQSASVDFIQSLGNIVPIRIHVNCVPFVAAIAIAIADATAVAVAVACAGAGAVVVVMRCTKSTCIYYL